MMERPSILLDCRINIVEMAVLQKKNTDLVQLFIKNLMLYLTDHTNQ